MGNPVVPAMYENFSQIPKLVPDENHAAGRQLPAAFLCKGPDPRAFHAARAAPLDAPPRGCYHMICRTNRAVGEGLP